MDNPFAFPRPSSANAGDYCDPAQAGMLLRDWFAGQALAGILARPAGGTQFDPLLDTDEAAELAYEYADLMLAARSAK